MHYPTVPMHYAHCLELYNRTTSSNRSRLHQPNHVPDMIILPVLYVVAIVAESMTAALAAGRRSMDWVGVCLLGCITALGGGSVRDILLNHYPLSWVAHPHYLVITTVAALATIAVARVMHHLHKLFLLLDAVGLVVFTIIGCNVALELKLPLMIVIVSGMITGCVGGVLRDILCNDIPLLFRSELYASVSIVTSALYLGGLHAGFNHELVMSVALLAGLALRMLALRFQWNMPKFIYHRDGH